MKSFLYLLLLLSISVFSQTSYTWNGATSTDWNTNTNWTPNGIPNTTDNVTIVTGANNCIIAGNTTISNLIINSGVLNISSFSFSVNGTSSAISGTVAATTGTLFCSGASVNFGNGVSGPVINSFLVVNSPSILTQRTTYNKDVVFAKTDGAVSNPSTGGNTFNSSLTMNYFSTIGSGYWSMGNGLSDIYNGDVTLNNNSLDRIILCHNSNTNQFNGNVILNQTGISNGISLSWNSNTGGSLASGKTISTGIFDVGYLYLQGITQIGTDAINITTTGTSQVYLGNGTSNNTNIFNGIITVTAPRIWASGSTYNNNVIFNKTGAGDSHNNTRQNIFNGTVEINNTSTGYFMLGYNSNDLFNENIIVSSTNTGGINLGWINGSTSTPVLAAGKTILVGAGGFTDGILRLGGFTQLGASSSINLTLTGTARLLINTGTSNSLFEGSFSVSAPEVTIQGGTFNGPAVFTKTAGTNTHNSGIQNIFNSTCTINQQSNSGYFMLGYNSNCIFNDDIILTCTGTAGIYLGFSGGTGSPTLASGKKIQIGPAGFTSGFLYLGGFTQLGTAPINLNLSGTAAILYFRASGFGGNFTASAGGISFSSTIFNGSVDFTKTGPSNDQGPGGNTFNENAIFSNTGSGYLMFGNGNLDIWNKDVVFTNSGTGRILPAYNSVGNLFNGNITVNSTGSSTGIQFCAAAAGTATLAATKNISTGLYDSGYLILTRFTQLGNAPNNINLTTGASYTQYGPSSYLGGDLISVSPNLLLYGCEFNGTSDFTITGLSNQYNPGGNIFNGTCSITHNGTGYFLLGNTAHDVWNSDITFTNNSNDRLLPAWGSVGNLFNGNIYVNTLGSAQGIQFCGGNTTATATLAATKTIAAGSLGLNAGYLQLKQFTQLGTAPITLTLSSTASYLQFGPLSNIGGNVTSLSPRLFFNGCTFNGTVSSEKNGAGNDGSSGNNIFNGSSIFTNSGAGYIYFGNGNADLFNSDATFNNTGSSEIQVAYNSPNNIFNGVTTFNNSPTANTGIFVSPSSAGTIFNENIIVTSTNGQGVQFCGGNTLATVTLVAGKTISIGGAGFTAGNLLLKQFAQISTTPQTLAQTTGNARLILGPNSMFDGDVNFNFPQVMLNGTTYNGLATIEKNGAIDNAGTGGNVFNGVTNITNSGSGYLMTGNGTRDLFNETTTFNNTGSYRIHIAYSHNGQTTLFAKDLILNSNKTSGVDTWSYFICEGTNTSIQYNGNVTYNIQGALQSNCRILDGSVTSAFYNGNLTINLTNGHPSTQIQMGTRGISTYNGNITIQNTAGGTSSGVFFNVSTAASSTLAATRTISLGAGGFVSGDLSLIRFNQLSATPQTLIQATGNARLILGPTSMFDGDVNFNFPQVFLNGTIYNGLATIQKNGIGDNDGIGGNIFNGTTIITNSGSGRLQTGSTNRDQFNALTTFNNTGSARFHFAQSHGGQTTTFGQDLIINSNKSGGTDAWSYFICEGTNTSVQYNGNVTYNIQGALQSNCRVLEGLGTTASYNGDLIINLSNSHPSTQIQMGTRGISTYSGNIVVQNTLGGISSGVFFNTVATASSTLAASKTISLGAGGFVNGDLSLIRFTQLSATPQTLIQTTGNARLILGPTSTFDGDVNFNFPQVFLNGTTYNGLATIQKNGAIDNPGSGGNIFNSTTNITNSGTGYLMTGNGTRDLFNGVTTFNNTGTHAIYFANNHANQTTVFAQPTILNSNKTGANSVSSYLISENANSHVQFNDKLTVNIDGTQRSDYRILLGNGATALYGEDFEMNISNTNTGTNASIGYNGISTYNGHISLTNSGGSGGIYFNQFSVASSTLLATKSISIGASGFNAGNLSLRNFTQLGAAPNSLLLTGPSNLTFGPNSLFGGNITSTSGALLFNTTTFNGVVTSSKNGTTNDISVGGNVFNGTTSLTNMGTGYLLMANSSSDAYNGDVIFTQNNTGLFYPNHNTNCTYAGNVTVNSTGTYTISFGQAAGGIATFNGGNTQTINKTGSIGNPVFTRLVINKSASDVTLNTRINISSYLTMTQGVINTTSVNIVNMNNASTTTIGNSLSYINGPMRYDMAVSGNRILNFPIGKSTDWRPAVVSATHNNATSYTYNSEVFNASARALSWTLPATVANVSRVHYWDINRSLTSSGVATPTTHLSGNQTITLYYDVNDDVPDPANLTICKNTHTAATSWIDIGGTGATIVAGSVTSTSLPSNFNSFSRFTLGNKVGGTNPLPIELLSFSAIKNGTIVDLNWVTATERNNSHFLVEKSYDGKNFESFANVKSYGNGNTLTKQTYNTTDNNPYNGISYYRLKQVDYNGDFTYSNTVSVEFNETSFINLYPNPANDKLTIRASDNFINATIKIINAIGVEVKVITLYNGTVDLSDLASGIYYFVIEKNGDYETIKITIQK